MVLRAAIWFSGLAGRKHARQPDHAGARYDIDAAAGGLEVRSIDYVPLNERHGKVWHLGPLWFMSNAQIATLAVGLISISEGASWLWSVLAIVAGVLVGTLFMAFPPRRARSWGCRR